MFVNDCRNVLVQDSYVEADVSYSRGGSVYLSEDNVGAVLRQLTFVETISYYDGGAVAMGSYNRDVLVEGRTFERITAFDDGGGNGGVIQLESSNLRFTMRSCDMIDKYSHHGGAVYLYSDNDDLLA